jgi:GNAT superfamily N-acetyltransferase
MNWRLANKKDSRLLAELNHQLIADEGHDSVMTVPQLEARMRRWLEEGYEAAIFEKDGETAAYALYIAQPEEVYLKHFFVARRRRRQGIGREAMSLLRMRIWPHARRLAVTVLARNADAIQFWRAMGYTDYCLTMEILTDGAYSRPVAV